MFARAIVRDVPNTISAGITTADLGQPDADKAREQHRSYVAALEDCGLEVTLLDPDELTRERRKGGERSARSRRYWRISTETSNV